MTVKFVSPTGNDNNPGSLEQPFQTITKAINSVATGQGAEIVLRGGEYRETVNINISGTPDKPIILRSYPGETVTINGCDTITGWSLHQGNIYKASMPWSVFDRQGMINGQPWANDQIFCNKQLMVSAQWPAIPAENVTRKRSIDNSRAGKCYRSTQNRAIYEGNFPSPETLVGAKINYWGFFNNVPTTGTVVSASPTRIEFEDTFVNLSDPYKPEYLQPSDKNFFYLWGKLEFLTGANQWFRDNNGILYFWPERGENPEGKIEAKKRIWGLNINGSYIRVENINLFACAIQTSPQSSFCQFENVTVEYTWSLQELHRLFWTFQKLGCRIDGNQHTFNNCQFLASAASHLILNGQGHKITDCVFKDSTYEAGHSTIFAKSSGLQHVFEQCTFAYSGGHHVRLDKRVTYKKCHFYGSHLQTSDLGVFHSWSVDCEGSEIAYNTICNSRAGDLDHSINNYDCCGILLDHSTYNVKIYRNLLFGLDKAIGCLGAKADLLPKGKTASDPLNVIIAHNTSTDNFGPGQNYPGLGITVVNNIFANLVTSTPQGMTVTGNWETTVKNPRFYSASNLRLKKSSPVIAKGSSLDGPWTRPLPPGQANPSPGVYEVNDSVWITGSRIKTVDLESINVSVSWDAGSNQITCLIDNLPPMRTLPDDFQILIGGKPLVIDEFTWSTDSVTLKNTFRIVGQAPVEGENLPVEMFCQNFSKTFQTISTVYNSPELFSQNVVIDAITPNGLSCIRIDSASLINSGKLDNQCGNLRLFNSNKELIEIWVESPNTNKTLIWFKAKNLKVGDTVELSYPHPVRDWSKPDNIMSIFLDANCVLWLRANAGVVLDKDGKVETWQDNSAEKRNARGDTFDGSWRTPLTRPDYLKTAISGMPAISFNGSQGMDVLGNFRLAAKQPRTFFAVLQRSEQVGPFVSVDNGNMMETGNFTGNNGIWSQGNDRLRLISQQTYNNVVDQNLYSANGSFPRNQVLVVTVIANNNGTFVRLNGKDLVSSNKLQQHYAIGTNLKLGRHQLNGYATIPAQYKGLLAEFILFDRDVSDGVSAIEEYLMAKYQANAKVW